MLIKFLLFVLFFAPSAFSMNIHLIDQDKTTGFAIYRYSSPSLGSEALDLCQKGISEVMVLSGNAGEYEDSEYNRYYCKNIKVIYNVDQTSKIPLTIDFLQFFDQWVAKAKSEGRKIAFRCNCGCHRTGRLAAYYRMKYNGFTAQKAIEEMNRLGYYMFLHPSLPNQVIDLNNYIQNLPCTLPKEFCVIR